MSQTFDILQGLPLAELRRLVALKENQDQILTLRQRRDELLAQARELQNEIDDLISVGARHVRRKRVGPSVKALCEEVLQKKKRGLTPAEVKNDILERYPHRNNRTFYNQVFIALTRNDVFRKDRDGRFTLATPSGGPGKHRSRRR